ncbi:MAG: hypothetical protein KGL11_04615 [Alphaproteobacteria bacterium]|nr:hypothetical protein [Alphaproteobacteria bacterium]
MPARKAGPVIQSVDRALDILEALARNGKMSLADPHRRLSEFDLITEESDQHQYRFKDIVDPQTGRVLFTIEHEVRSTRHPLYARPLVNRNPSQTNLDYASGHDAWIWGMPHQS